MKDRLEALYLSYNSRDFVHPDPLEFLYRYDDPLDREVAGLIASALAYGRVARILVSVARVLDPMGPSPRRFLLESPESEIAPVCSGFTHRFCREADIAAFLLAIRRVLKARGTIEAAFAAGFDPSSETVLPGLHRLRRAFTDAGFPAKNHLLPDPASGSAVKRLNLYLRWMVRQDAVDPGGWTAAAPRHLIVPLDTHLHRVARNLGLTKRTASDMKTALEITAALRSFSPDDPVRYDFALTRPGIRGE